MRQEPGAVILPYYLSYAVGDSGLVYASDIAEFELKSLTFYKKEFGIKDNIIISLGKIDDPLFQVDNLDMIIVYHSFHDFERQEE